MKECEYKGNFDSWESVVRNFKGSFLKKDLPTEVLYANYDTPPYEGEALVIWRKGRKYYLLHGSHCSCYGLEETGWSPEEFKNKKEFIQFLEKASYYTFDNDVKDLLKRLKGK